MSWSAPGDGGSPVTGYDLRHRVAASGGFSAGPFADGPQGVTGTTATVTGLASGTLHEVQVRARNAKGVGPWSESGSAMTSGGTAAPPLGGHVLVGNFDQGQDAGRHLKALEVAQGFRTGSNAAGYTLTSIQVRRGPDVRRPRGKPAAPINSTAELREGGPKGRLAATLTGTLSDRVYTFAAPSGTTLLPGTDYYFLVEAECCGLVLRDTESGAEDPRRALGWSVHDHSHGRSAGAAGPFVFRYSRPLMIRVNGAVSFAASPRFGGTTIWSATLPRSGGLTDDDFEVGGVTYRVEALRWVSWDAEKYADEHSIYPGLRLELDRGLPRSVDISGWFLNFGTESVPFSAALRRESRSLFRWEVYTVFSPDPLRNRPFTVSITDAGAGLNAAPPSAPAALTAAGTGAALSVEWAPPAHDGGADIVGYDLRYRKAGSGGFAAGPQDVTGTSATIGGLSPDTEYEVQVRARSALRDGPWSESATARTAVRLASLVERSGPDLLVGNGSESLSATVADLSARDHAQGFRTGGHEHHYLLESVDIHVAKAGILTSVVLGSDEPNAGQDAGRQVARLSGRRRLGTGWHEFRAPPGTYLSRSRWYYLVLEGGPPGVTGLRLSTTASRAEDDDGTGWRIDDNVRTRTPDSFDTYATSPGSLRIRVNGRRLGSAPVVRREWSSVSGREMALVMRTQAGQSVSLDTGSVPDADAFDVVADGASVGVAEVAFGYTKMTLTLAEPVRHGQEVTVSYERPHWYPVTDSRRNALQSFTDARIPNRTPRPASLPPPEAHVWWDATMTAGLSGSNVVGYIRNSGTGSLSPGSFQEGGTTRQVSSLTVNSTNQLLALGFQGEVPEARRNRMVLRVGGRSFRLSDATFGSHAGESTFTWTNSGLSWSAGDRVDAYLVEPQSAPVFGSSATRILCRVDEHVPMGTAVCTQPARDPQGGPVTYRLAGKDARFYRVGSGGTVYTDVPAAEFDWESREFVVVCSTFGGGLGGSWCDGPELATYKRDSVTLVATDEQGASARKALAVQVEDAAVPPAAQLSVEAVPVTVRVPDFPASHDGSTHVTFELVFSEAPVDATPARIMALVEATNAAVHDARRAEAGSDLRWTVELAPSAAAAIVVSIPATEDCTEANAICSEAGGMLEEGTAFQIPYAAPGAPDPVTASFEGLPEAHGGNGGRELRDRFRRPRPRTSTRTRSKANLTVTDGTLGTVSRETEGSNARWSVTVTPSPGDDLVIALAETTDCEAANAICTGFGGKLETVPSPATIPYQAGFSGQGEIVPAEPVVATFHGVPETHDGSTAVSFEIAFAPEPATLTGDTVKENLTAYNGTVGAVTRVTAGSNARWRASVTPEAGNNLRIVLNPTVGCAFPNAICTAAGGRVEASTEAGIDYAAPLTVAYTEGHEPPAEHDGRTAFKFRISFSEDPVKAFRIVIPKSRLR